MRYARWPVYDYNKQEYLIIGKFSQFSLFSFIAYYSPISFSLSVCLFLCLSFYLWKRIIFGNYLHKLRNDFVVSWLFKHCNNADLCNRLLPDVSSLFYTLNTVKDVYEDDNDDDDFLSAVIRDPISLHSILLCFAEKNSPDNSINEGLLVLHDCRH